MKKFTFLMVAFVMSVNLCACACDNSAPATTPTTTTTIMPTETITVPVPETNIPDPEIDSSGDSMLPDETPGENTTGRSGLNGMIGGTK